MADKTIPVVSSPPPSPPGNAASSPVGATSPKPTPGSGLSFLQASPSTTGIRTGPPVKYGLTDPVSLQEPTEADIVLSERMTEELQVVFPAETPEGMLHRQNVLNELEKMVLDWMTDLGIAAGLSEDDAKRSTIKITTLGSYRLGVVHPGSDIDTLCIAPPHVSREDFFTSFADLLLEHSAVSECVPVPDAYTPIIKLKFRSVYVDLLFARLVKPLAEGETLEELAKYDEVLIDMDERCVRCMNGFRVADLILKLVPNEETFRRTLRFIKYWARQRGIYSNVLGFFGGITWSLLVARVCQLYPYYAPSQLISRFFRVYHQWNWTKPVLLCEIMDPQNMPGMTSFKVWNPKVNPADRAHIMPVITPSFPSMNSTHNVTETTKRILLDEFKRGYETVKKIETQNAQWSEVTETHPFFTTYKHFLWVEILALHDEVFKKFSGWVESKMRILTMQLEQVSGMMVHPNPHQYDMVGSDPEWPFGCGMFVSIIFAKEDGSFPGLNIDLRPALTQFLEVINQWVEKDSYIDQYRLRFRRIKGSELPQYATAPEEFKKLRGKRAGLGQTGEASKKARLGAS